MKRLQTDNRGFSLVELLIAIVILGIIAGPLLHTFVTSASATVRSRRMGDATLAAQNLSERVEAASLSSLLTDPAGVLGGSSAAFYNLDAHGDYTADTGTQAYRDGSYHIGVTGVTSDTSRFEAMISLTAADYNTANGALISSYTAMDAVYAQPVPESTDDLDTAADLAFTQHASSLDGTLNTGWSREREILLNVETRDEKLYAQVDYVYQYTYTYERYMTGEDGGLLDATETARGTFSTTQAQSVLFPDGFVPTTAKPLPAIYLLYYPDYSRGDEITISNLDSLPFILFLVKQQTPSLSDGALAGKEALYTAQIKLDQRCGFDDGATIHSNAAQDLTSGNTIAGVSYRVHRSEYVGVTRTLDSTLVEQTPQNRLYQVTVALYPAGAGFSGDPVYTFQSTKLQ